MSIAKTLECYLKEQCIEYRLVKHAHTGSSMETAAAARVPSDLLAKAVVVRAARSYCLVVVPSDDQVDLERIQALVEKPVQLATEEELTGLFPDCEPGAVPPIGVAYELRTLVDQRLLGRREVYFESGDHEHLIKISGDQFAMLMDGTEQVDLGRPI